MIADSTLPAMFVPAVHTCRGIQHSGLVKFLRKCSISRAVYLTLSCARSEPTPRMPAFLVLEEFRGCYFFRILPSSYLIYAHRGAK